MRRMGVVLALVLQVALSAAADAGRGSSGDQKQKPDPAPEELLKSYGPDIRPEDVPAAWTLLRIGTWNTMLEPWLPYESQAIQAIATAPLDVLVLQEVWSEAAKDRILSNPLVRWKYRYSHWLPAAQRPAACSLTPPPHGPAAFEARLNSLEPKVPEQSVNDYIGCLISTGTDTRTLEHPAVPVDPLCQFLGLNIALQEQPCFECLQSTMQTLPNGDAAYGARELCGEANGVKYGHQGSPGQLILSNRPVQDAEEVAFTTYANRRVNAYATIGGVSFGFVHFPTNYLADVDPSLGPLQAGALQPELAQDVVRRRPSVVLGDFNSGPDYQPEAYNLLKQNGYRPLFSQPTRCPASLQSFPGCEGAPAPRSIDNIFLLQNTGACLKWTFAEKMPASEHIGLAAICILKKQ